MECLQDSLELLSRRVCTLVVKLELQHALLRLGLADCNELLDLFLGISDDLDLLGAELVSLGLVLLGRRKGILRNDGALGGLVVLASAGLIAGLLVVVDKTKLACLLALNLDLSLVLLVLLVDGGTGLLHVSEHRGGLRTRTSGLDVVDGVLVLRASKLIAELLEKSDNLRLGEDTHGAVSWACVDDFLDLLLDIGHTGKLLSTDLVVRGVLRLALVLKVLVGAIHDLLSRIFATKCGSLLGLLHLDGGRILVDALLILLLLLLDLGDDVIEGLEQIVRVAVDVLLLHVLSDWDGRDHGHGEGQKNANSLHIACG